MMSCMATDARKRVSVPFNCRCGGCIHTTVGLLLSASLTWQDSVGASEKTGAERSETEQAEPSSSLSGNSEHPVLGITRVALVSKQQASRCRGRGQGGL
jgi:hypothetical protein